MDTQFKQSPQVDLDEAISQPLELQPPAQDTSLNNLEAQFQQESQQTELDEVISLQRQALGEVLQLSSHPDKPILIANLATALFTRFELGGQQIDLNEAVSLYKEALDLQLPPHTQRNESLDNLASAFLTRQEGQQTNLDEAISPYRQALEIQLPLDSDKPILITNLASALLTRFEHEGQQIDLDGAISLTRQVLKFQLPPHPDRYTSLMNLASALSTRFEQVGQKDDIDEVISLYREAMPELALAPYPYRFSFLIKFCCALLTRGERVDLDGAIFLLRQALELQFPHPDRPDLLYTLGQLLMTRSLQGGEKKDIDEAISFHRQAREVRLPTDSDDPDSLNQLAFALHIRFKQGGQRIDLDEIISLHRQGLEFLIHPQQSLWLNDLAIALLTRFEQGGQRTDLDESISFSRQALEVQLPVDFDRSLLLNNLAHGFLIRFEQEGRQTDLDEAISLHKEALELRPPPHAQRSQSLNNLASALSTRFKQGGPRIDLDESIFLRRQALELLIPTHVDRPASLTNLSSALLTRFEQGGQQSDLDEAISLTRQALELQPPPNPNRYISLNNLANALNTQFERAGQQADLDEATLLHRQALELQLPLHHHRPNSLDSLANTLQSRFRQGNQKIDLDEAISLYRQALQVQLPPHPHRSDSLNNLACALLTRFTEEGQNVDLDEAISLHRQALELRQPPHPHRSTSLRNLAPALRIRFQQGGQRIDLDEAICLQRQAIELQPSPHPDRSASLCELGTLLVLAHPLEVGNGQEYLDEAMSSFSAATQCLSQSPYQRIRVTYIWASYAEDHQHISEIDAYEAALQAVPQMAALSFDIQMRQRALANVSNGLAQRASRCAIRSGNLYKAIEFLEAGRSIFWSQVLSLRSPFDQLDGSAPELADKLREIATELESASHRDVSENVDRFSNRQKLSVHDEGARLNRLNEEWVQSINQVRNLPGFEDFLRPSRLSSLRSAASERPVIILVENHDSSHCLIMTLTGVHHIPLPNLPTSKLKQLIQLVRMAISQSSISRSFLEKTEEETIDILGEERGVHRAMVRFEIDSEISSDDTFRYVLRVLWDELVKPVINWLNIKRSGDIPVLQWCPTGHFTFLPIHAAGCYDDNLATTECVSDYFISSYTPTIGALLVHPPVSPSHTLKMMVVIQSQELSSTKKELENIQRHLSSDALVTFGVPGRVANVETVASHLSEVSIVHFACHGTQDQLKPLNSGLKLDDGLLRVSRIMKEKMPNGSLAFLCACETAMGHEERPDEAMSLGATLLFSGFHSVIGTMWEIRDQDGPTIADAFYEELFQGSDGKPSLKPDTMKSAQALHIAVKKLRSQNVPFRRWIPFIHMGK